jgi:uncharacterized membrane protein YhaH (DUF805 family)
MEWMVMPLKRYADFSGRSRRMEYWMYTLLQFIVILVLYALVIAGGGLSLMTAGMAANEGATLTDQAAVVPGPLFWVGCIALVLWGLGTIIPSLAVAVRRLHDRNMSGWYLLGFVVVVFVLSMIPVLGTLVVLLLEIGWIVLMALPGTPGPNNYGPDPLGQVDPEVFA